MHFLRFLVVSLAGLALSVNAQISLTLSGTGTNTFNSLPTVLSGWSTAAVPGFVSNIMSAVDLDAAVQTNSASWISNALVSTTAQGGYQLARWNSLNRNIQTRPNGDSYTLLMATLENQTGGDVYAVEVAYDYAAVIAPGAYIDEEVPGYLAYYSLSGEPNSWTLIPGLSTNGNPESLIHLTSTINFSSAWQAGDQLYLLWADDNAVATSSDSGEPDREGTYTIDNFSVQPVQPPFSVRVTPQDISVDEYSATTLTAQAIAGTPPYSFQWYFNVTPLPNQTNVTLQLTNIPASAGGSYFVVVQDSSSGSAQFATNSASVVVVPPPTLKIAVIDAQQMEVSWPETASVFQLQSTANLGVGWEQASETDNPSGGYHRVRVNSSTGVRMFRLLKP